MPPVVSKFLDVYTKNPQPHYFLHLLVYNQRCHNHVSCENESKSKCLVIPGKEVLRETCLPAIDVVKRLLLHGIRC